MALFKILKGQGANLPSGKVEGYAYVTTDTHKFYVDISASERIELNAFAADRLSSLGTAHQALVGKTSDDAISANPVWRDVSPSVSITNGTAAGPTVKITVLGEDSLATAFPTATAARSGVVSVGDQVFFGNKKFQMKDTIELRTGDKPYWINKNLDWEATSYKRWVILLVPELTASNQVVNNFLEGKFCFYKLGGNLLDAVDLTLNVCYNEIKYYLQNFGDNATFNLCRVVYNNIAYIALNVGYQSNPYSSVSFTGHVYSTLDGGNEGANFPLNLPFAVNYRTEAHGDTAEIINNAEVNSSITDTLTTSLITNVTRYNLKFYADGANITNLNASNLTNGTVPLERIPSLPTSKITSGVLPVARGGTGVGSWTVNQVVLTNASDGTGAFTSRGYKDSTSAEAIGTTSDFVTERDIYYGLPKINNSHAYTSNIGIYAPNGHGNASSALMGNDSDAAPTWVAVAPAAAFANGTDSAGPSLTITVLGLTSTGVVIPKGSTSVYGVLKLTEAYTSTDSSLAVTGKSIKAAIDQLDVAEVGGSGKYISAIKEVDGKITATVTSTSVSNSWANGTTAGPSITTTVNGVAATAAVIPSASGSVSGVVTTGAQTFEGEKTFNKNIIFADANVGVRRVGRSVNWVDGRDSAVIATTSINGYGALASIKTTNGSWEIGAYNHSSYTDDLLFSYCTDVDHASATYNNRTTAQIKFLENGHIVAALDGNASSATKLATARAINGTNFDGTAAITTAKWGTARTLTIGGTGKSVDGSANVSWTKAEILGSSTNAYFYRGDQTWSNTLNGAFTANGTITANGGYLKSTANSNTVTIGSQNASFTHIYNSANIPFIFNKAVLVTDKCTLGNTTYPWGNIYVGGADNGIYFVGTKNTYRMIRFIDNTADTYGNGIAIGGGGLTIIGAGESANTMVSNLGYTGGSEAMVIASDGNIRFFPGNDSYDASAELTMSASRFWAGVNGNTAREAQVGVQSGAGQLYMWSHAATTGSRGIYTPAHGTGGARAIFTVDTNNRVYFADSYNGTSTALAYSQAGMAAASVSWMTCWNGYELRAINAANTRLFAFGSSAIGNVNTPIYWTGSNLAATNNKLGAINANGYWGMRGADNGDSWIRTTSAGIIPVQSGGAGSGHCGIGTSSWYFSYMYSDNDYAVHQRSSGRAYMGEWIEFSGAAHGLYCPNGNGAHWYPNNVSSYGTWMMQGSRGGYSGIHLGNATTYMTIMGGTVNNGLYCEAKGRWIVYYNTTNDRISLNAANVNNNVNVAISGSCGATGEFISTTSQGFRLIHNNRGVFWHWNGSTPQFYLMFTDAGSPYGSWNSARPFYVNASTYYSYFTRAYNAVWNDYAEFRIGDTTEPGYCVTETASGVMTKTTERLQAGAKVISDTYGTAMGETKTAKTPIAVSGRVLAYPYRDRTEYPLGAAVCAAPDGTVDLMTREEIMTYPERIVGTVSEIPDYEKWHCGGDVERGPADEVDVNGRIWIYVR